MTQQTTLAIGLQYLGYKKIDAKNSSKLAYQHPVTKIIIIVGNRGSFRQGKSLKVTTLLNKNCKDSVLALGKSLLKAKKLNYDIPKYKSNIYT